MEQLREQLVELINSYNGKLPPEGVYYIFKDVFRDLQDTYYEILKTQKADKGLDNSNPPSAEKEGE